MCSRGSQRESFEQMNEVIAHRTGRTHDPTCLARLDTILRRPSVGCGVLPEEVWEFCRQACDSQQNCSRIYCNCCATNHLVFTKENRGGGGEDSVLQRANSVLYPARLPQHTSQPSRSRCV